MCDLKEESLDSCINELLPHRTCVILENNKEGYPVRIRKILCRNNRLFILSWASRRNQLLVFDTSGRFLFKVGVAGRARNEYLGIDGFDVSPNGDICINDLSGEKILKFDKQGRHLETITSPHRDIYNMKQLSEDRFLFCLGQWTSSDPKKELLLHDFASKMDSTYTYYRKQIDDNYLITSPDFTVAKEAIFFLNNLNDTLYRMETNGRLTGKIYFDFGERKVPSKDKVNLEQKIEQEQLFEKYTTLATFACEDEKYIYGGLFEAGKHKYFVLDEQKRTIYKTDPERFTAFGQVVGFDDQYLISRLDYTSYEQNPHAFDEQITKALQADQTIILLYTKQ